jgi:hypothetical protein
MKLHFQHGRPTAGTKTKCHASSPLLMWWPGLPDFYRYNIPKREKNTINLPNIPNTYKMYQKVLNTNRYQKVMSFWLKIFDRIEKSCFLLFLKFYWLRLGEAFPALMSFDPFILFHLILLSSSPFICHRFQTVSRFN